MSLIARKRKLALILRRHDHSACVTPNRSSPASSSLAEGRKRGLEGIATKRKHAPYKSGKCDWIKVKCAEWREEHKFRGLLYGEGRQ